MNPDEVPPDLVAALKASANDAYGYGIDDLDARHILAAILPEARKAWFSELLGTPEEIAAREAEAEQRTPDDTVRLCELAQPGEHERRVRERVAAEHPLIAPEDLAELLHYVVGKDAIRVISDATLDRAFAALKALDAHGEGR